MSLDSWVLITSFFFQSRLHYCTPYLLEPRLYPIPRQHVRVFPTPTGRLQPLQHTWPVNKHAFIIILGMYVQWPQKVFGQLSHILNHFITFPRPVYFRFMNNNSDEKIIIAVFHMLFFQIITCKPPTSQNHSHHQRTDTFNMQRNTQSLCPGENLHMHQLILTCMWYKSCPHTNVCFLSCFQDLLLIDQVKEFAANVYETFSTPQELQKWAQDWARCERRTNLR